MVLGLTLIYRPRLQYAIEAQQRQVEDADEDDNGDPDTPTRHLMRQLRRIRRGEEVDGFLFASDEPGNANAHAPPPTADPAICGKI